VIKRNRELVARFEPLEDVDNFGLDHCTWPRFSGGHERRRGINAFDIDPFVIALVDAERTTRCIQSYSGRGR
jgi:hypothetical protein